MSPFFEEWPEENPVVPMDKLMEYLHVNNDLLEEQSCYQHRPYCWSNSVASLDGITSFHEPESTGPAYAIINFIKFSDLIVCLEKLLWDISSRLVANAISEC